MKKTLYAVFLFLFSASAVARSDFNVEWRVGGVPEYTSVSIDINFGTEYITANGGLTTREGLTIPLVGTCFEQTSGGVFCNLNVGNMTAVLDIGASLNGTFRVYNYAYTLMGSGTLNIVAIN